MPTILRFLSLHSRAPVTNQNTTPPKSNLGETCEFIVFIYRASVRGHLEESGWLQSRHTTGNSYPSMDGSFLQLHRWGSPLLLIFHSRPPEVMRPCIIRAGFYTDGRRYRRHAAGSIHRPSSPAPSMREGQHSVRSALGKSQVVTAVLVRMVAVMLRWQCFLTPV